MAKSRHILTILFSFFLVSFLFLSQATPAHAGLLDLIGSKAKNATQKASEKAVQAALEAEKGNSSLDSTTQNVGGGFQTFLFLSSAGANDKTLSAAYFNSLTSEEKQILADKYGNGAIGDVGNWVAALYNPPASSQTYLADVLDNMNIVPKAQAQGLGFASLDPILETWKVFRNIAYLFFVIIFLVIGFMIMFRHKIKGQAVVTAQQAIPSVIIALIMVTFSYAIAGLMIDGMYVLMYLIVSLFGANTQLIDMNIFQIGWKFIVSGSTSAFSTVNDTIQSIVEFGIVSDFIAGAGGLTIALIIAVAILIGVFKLFFELLKTYVNIILSITFAPLILMFGALPGQNTFGKWLTSLIGNLLVFPAVLLILIMHQMMKTSGGITTGGFMPPYILGRGVGDIINTVVGLGLILILPELVQKLKKMMGADGGVFAEFGAAAWKNAVVGSPVATKALGFLGGAAAGAGMGAAQGFLRNRDVDPETRRRLIASEAMRYAGDYASAGVKSGGWLATQLGGKTPAPFSIIEKGIDTLGGTLTGEAQIKRAGKTKQMEGSLVDKAMYGFSLPKTEFDRRKALAERESERKFEMERALREGRIEDARKLSVVKD